MELTNDKREWYRNTYLKSDHWRALRTEKLRKSSGLCAVCGKPGNDLHHIDYKRLFDVTTADLRLLCRPCHDGLHALQRRGLLQFRNDTPVGMRFALARRMLLGDERLISKAQRRSDGLTRRRRYDERVELIQNNLRLYKTLTGKARALPTVVTLLGKRT